MFRFWELSPFWIEQQGHSCCGQQSSSIPPRDPSLSGQTPQANAMLQTSGICLTCSVGTAFCSLFWYRILDIFTQTCIHFSIRDWNSIIVVQDTSSSWKQSHLQLQSRSPPSFGFTLAWSICSDSPAESQLLCCFWCCWSLIWWSPTLPSPRRPQTCRSCSGGCTKTDHYSCVVNLHHVLLLSRHMTTTKVFCRLLLHLYRMLWNLISFPEVSINLSIFKPVWCWYRLQ